MEEETDMEHIYFPRNSRALDDRKTVRDTFPDRNNVSYNAFSQSDVEESVSLLFQTDGDIFENNTLYEIGDIVNRVKSVTAVSSGQTQMYSDVCARAASQCVIDGEYVLGKEFQTALKAGSVTYPNWESSLGNIGLFSAIAGVELKSGKLMSATVLKISFKLTSGSKAWQRSFSTLAKDLDPVWTEVTYETPNSLNEEVENSMNDVWLFFLTIVIMLGYAVMVTAGGDPVSSRTMLAFGGVLAAGLGIVGSMGLLCLCGVKYVNIMGVIPFLIIGIGVDDMFLMMSSWSETIPQTDLSVPDRVGATLAGAGIGITITSVTDVLAFAIGTTSVFRSVTSFSLYADVVFDSTGKGIEASRCFVLSEPNSDQYAQADLMIRMRELADASSLPVFAYHSAFVVFEQFLAVLPATLQMVGFAVVIMSIVTFTFLPHLPMVLLVTLTIGMILLGIFGFMHFWDISLSSLTMIHLVMSVGFSVDFSAHVCVAYMVSGGTTRTERAYDAITHAAGPVLNGGLSTLLGVLMPVFSESYIFTSFARIMFMVIGFGVLHAILFLPVVLSFIGPQGH
nr:hypothetical protein BaRGS_033333 [Batillaria attramentaria]